MPLSAAAVIERMPMVTTTASQTRPRKVASAAGCANLEHMAMNPRPTQAQNAHMEIINHPNYEKTVFMPFSPAIKIKSGQILWMDGARASSVS